jgi:hypothetical protein
MGIRIAQKWFSDCLPIHFLGCATALGSLLVTTILLQPLYGTPFEQPNESFSTEVGDSTPQAFLPYAENQAAESDSAACLTCVPTKNCERRGYFFADALFWNVREGAAENWAQIITPQNLTWTNISTATVVEAPFDWRTGMRFGAGVQRNDGSELTVSYTNFRTSARSQAAGEVYSAFMGNFYIGNPDGADYGPHYRQAGIWWDFDFHTIDFEVGRNYAIGTNLELRPFLGLKAAMINQTINSSWFNPIDTLTLTPHQPIIHIYDFTSAVENMNLNFWGIGPSLGTTITMPLCSKDRYSLKLFGTPSGAIMFGRWTFSEQYKNNAPTPVTITINMDPITGAATMLRGLMGIEWEQRFARATSTVRLGYEAQLWLNQMQFYSYNIGRLNNVTSLQGGFLEWQVKF